MVEPNLVRVLNNSKVLPVTQMEGLVFGKTSEGLVSDSFFKRCELETALRYDLAVVFNLIDNMTQSVKFCNHLCWYDYSFIFIDNNWSADRDLNHDSIMLSSKENVHLIKL